MAKQQPKSSETEEAVEVIPGVFSDEAEDRQVTEKRQGGGVQELETEDQAVEEQDEEDDEPAM